MKIFATLVALCACHPTMGYIAQAPKAFSSKGWKTASAVSPAFSYLASLGASDTSENTTKEFVADMVTSSTELNIKESYDTYFSKADALTVDFVEGDVSDKPAERAIEDNYEVDNSYNVGGRKNPS
jgi:hypothetical protein